MLRTLRPGDNKGVTLAFVAIMMVVFLGIAALAIDVGYAFVIRNELQNAADSAALAGAQVLYLNNGTAINPNAQVTATQFAVMHESEGQDVIVESARRGHWSFATRQFTPNDSLLVVDLWDVTTEELDADPNFINAVEVVTSRSPEATPFFARILGQDAPFVRTRAVAYIGFAGTLEVDRADQPIAICDDALRINGEYTCTVGRMLNSDNNTDEYSGTGGWTDFSQPDSPTGSCSGASSQQEMRDRVCQGNPAPLLLGYNMSTTGGVQDVTFRQYLMEDCWQDTPSIDLYHVDGTEGSDGIPDQPWSLTLPVIQCDSNNVTSCSRLIGAVVVNVVWMIRNNPPNSDPTHMTPRPEDTPRRMGDWACDPTYTDRQCWVDFVDHFNLEAPDGTPAIASAKTIYFLPDCAPHVPTGGTGGENFGILARIPVLVR